MSKQKKNKFKPPKIPDALKDNMFARCLKQYAKGLHYYFTPLGTLAIALVLGLTMFLPSATSAISNIFVHISETSGKPFNLNELIDLLLESINELDWHGNPMGAAATLLNGSYIKVLLSKAAETLFGESSVTPEVGAMINDTVGALTGQIVGITLFLEIGLIAGYMIVKTFIRRDIAKRSIWKTILVTAIDALINALVVTGIIFLMGLWNVSAFISIPLALVVTAVIALFEAYLAHGYKKVPLKTIIHPKSIATLYLTDLIFLLIGVAIIAILFLATNFVAGLFIGIPFLEITFILIELNAEAYICREVEKELNKPKEAVQK